MPDNKCIIHTKTQTMKSLLAILTFILFAGVFTLTIDRAGNAWAFLSDEPTAVVQHDNPSVSYLNQGFIQLPTANIKALLRDGIAVFREMALPITGLALLLIVLIANNLTYNLEEPQRE